MVTNILTEEMVQKGAGLIKKLDEVELTPAVAFWLFSSDNNTWKLFIAEKEMAKKGPRYFYKKIQYLIYKTLDLRDFPLENIVIMPVNDPLCLLIRMAVKTEEKDISKIYFQHSSINGVMVEDALIYRVN